MSKVVSEIIQQPRTGIQKTGYAAQCSTAPCEYDRGDHSRASWDTKNSRAKKATFGYVQGGDRGSVSDGCPNGQWGWQPGDGSSIFCIRPVSELCAIPAWDGYDYETEGWAQRYWSGDSNNNPLMRVLDRADFVEPGVSRRTSSGKGGGETITEANVFDLRCDYNVGRFTDLSSVQAWEQRYGKYPRNTEGGEPGDTLRQRRRHSTGETYPLQSPDAPFTDNYESIMQSYCAQPVEATASSGPVCMMDPLTKEPGNKCSRLKSLTPGGLACRYWLNSYGPFKWKQTQAVGERYCTAHPDSFDCRCFSRNDPNNPQYETFQKVAKAMQSTGETNPGCYYLPCGDPTTYIMPDSVWSVPGNTNDPTAGYGMVCTDNLCLNLVDLDGDTQDEISNNSLYINCGTGSDQPPVVGAQPGTIQFFFESTYRTQPILFSILIASMVFFGLFVLALLMWGLSSGGTTPAPAQNRYSPKPTS